MNRSQNWTQLHARVHRTIRERDLLQTNQRILLAVSGGQDSLCLARLMLDLSPKWGWQLAIAHCNHRWRTDSTANALYVEQLAQSWAIPFYLATADTVLASEADARQWRYQAFTDLAHAHNYTSVATGHTASDRAETLLYNLLRGSGADGLQALSWQRQLAPGVTLVRPLLDVSRAETAAYCEVNNLKVWEDSTNDDLHYARNRIRQELLPYLKTHFNPNVEQTLAQTAELLRAEVDYLEGAANQLWQEAIASEPADTPQARCWKLKRSVLRQSPLALQRRVVRRFLQMLLPAAPSFEQIEKVVTLMTAPNQSQTDPFPGGAIARVEADWIRLKI